MAMALHTHELAEYLRVHPSTIYRLLRHCTLRAFKGRLRLALQPRSHRPLAYRPAQTQAMTGRFVETSFCIQTCSMLEEAD
jgi:excisionase family DNA binding protein